jgi:hypothetical protein
MSLSELLEFLEQSRSALLERAGEVSDLYRSLSESLRTLAVPFRNSLASITTIDGSLKPENAKLGPPPRMAELKPGSVEHNTERLVGLINQIYAIRNSVIPVLGTVESESLDRAREIHADILRYVGELYQQNTSWILQDPGAETSVMARQKRRDIEELLGEEIDPYFDRLITLRRDEYQARLIRSLREDPDVLEIARSTGELPEELLREKCALLGLDFDRGHNDDLLREVRAEEGELERRIRDHYEEAPAQGEMTASSLRRRYLAILQRYLARVADVSALLSIVESVYDLCQPRASFAERVRVFFARLFGRDERLPRRDVEYSYIVGKDKIERRRASIENLIRSVNNLEKMLLRIKNHLNEYVIHKRLGEYPVSRARDLIDRVRGAMRSVFDDCYGLMQWLGKTENRGKLELLPQNSQRELNAHLDSLYATLIINAERLRDVERQNADPESLQVEGETQ